MAILAEREQGYYSHQTESGYQIFLPKTLASLVTTDNSSTVQDEITNLNNSLKYTSTETKIGTADNNKTVYRKVIRFSMTSFTKPTSGYVTPTVPLGISGSYEVLSATATYAGYPNPYSASGSVWSTWLRDCLNNKATFYNNSAWGSAYTGILTIEYMK